MNGISKPIVLMILTSLGAAAAWGIVYGITGLLAGVDSVLDKVKMDR